MEGRWRIADAWEVRQEPWGAGRQPCACHPPSQPQSTTHPCASSPPSTLQVQQPPQHPASVAPRCVAVAVLTQKQPKGSPKGEDVALKGALAPPQDLGCQPAWVGGGHAAHDRVFLHQLGQVEVRHLPSGKDIKDKSSIKVAKQLYQKSIFQYTDHKQKHTHTKQPSANVPYTSKTCQSGGWGS